MRDKTPDFYRAGRALYKDNPAFFALLNKKVEQCQQQGVADVSLIKRYFYFFCIVHDKSPDLVRAIPVRSTEEQILTKRLFIALILKVYDPLYIAGYAGRMTDKLRRHISDCLNCHEVWVSNVAPSVKHELNNLKGYADTVQALLSGIEAMMQDENKEVPEFFNTRNDFDMALPDKPISIQIS